MLFTQIGFAQKTFIFPKVKTQGTSVEQLTPNNWTIIETANGDLNGDGNVDILDFPVIDANINAGIFSKHP